METITLVILGIYTFIYLIIFFIQKSEIDKLKEINSSMKTFMDIFKIDEVKKYVELKNETTMMNVNKIINDNEKLKEITDKAILNKVDQLKKTYEKQMGDEHMELVRMGVNVILSVERKKRKLFIETNLPMTKRYFLKILEEIDEQSNEAEK